MKYDNYVEACETVEDIQQMDKNDDKNRKYLKRKVLIRNVIIGVLIVIIVLLFLRIYNSKDRDYLINRVFNQETNDYIENKGNDKEQEIGRIDIPVLIDTTISEDQPYMTLYNPETNADKFYLKYELYNKADDKLLYSSEMVEPGQKFSANLFDVFQKEGTYNCYMKVRTFEFGSMDERNGITNNITITVN